LPGNNCCAIRPPEALRAANRKTGISMPEKQNRRFADPSFTLSLSTLQLSSGFTRFRLILGLENTAIRSYPKKSALATRRGTW